MIQFPDFPRNTKHHTNCIDKPLSNLYVHKLLIIFKLVSSLNEYFYPQLKPLSETVVSEHKCWGETDIKQKQTGSFMYVHSYTERKVSYIHIPRLHYLHSFVFSFFEKKILYIHEVYV
jgi:hypothetical protein